MFTRLIPILVCLLVVPLMAQGEDPRLAERSGELRGEILELASWCKGERLLRERHRLLELVLELDPYDAKIRKDAGYRKITSKRWERPVAFRTPVRSNAKKRPEFKERLGPIVDRVLGTLEGLHAEGEKPLPLADRRRVIERLFVLMPRDARVLEAKGWRKKGARWYLEESLTGKARRRSFRNQARALIEGEGDPDTIPIPDPESGFDLPFKPGKLMPEVQVIGTVSEAELEDAARVANATINWFRLAMRRPAPTFQGFRIVLLSQLEHRDLYLHLDRRAGDEFRRFAENLTSAWIPSSSTVLIWAPTQKLRREWVARQTVAMLLSTGFGISTKQGALYEGFGLYLAHKITGERSTWYVKPSRYDQKNDDTIDIERLKTEKSWLRLARKRAVKKAPDYRRMLSLEVNQMEIEDLVGAYALAAYLLEGSPERLQPFLDAVAKGTNFEHAALEVWGFDAAALGERVGRWLKESVRG